MDYRCSSGKLQYQNESEAKMALHGRESRARMRVKGRIARMKLMAYKCSICNLWHLGGTSK